MGEDSLLQQPQDRLDPTLLARGFWYRSRSFIFLCRQKRDGVDRLKMGAVLELCWAEEREDAGRRTGIIFRWNISRHR
jgi:hypothetical protein